MIGNNCFTLKLLISKVRLSQFLQCKTLRSSTGNMLTVKGGIDFPPTKAPSIRHHTINGTERDVEPHGARISATIPDEDVADLNKKNATPMKLRSYSGRSL